MLATMIPAAFASDLDGHWSKNFIEYLDDEGIINPSATTGKYEPERKVTRAEFMRYVNRAFHFTEKASISYSDVQSNSWYYDTVRIAEKYGYINGTGNGRMNPEGYVTREQAAVILGRLYKADPGNVKPANLSFKDKAKVAAWSAGYVKAAVDKGIITGYKDNTFKPTKVITRAELAKILYYYLGTSLSTAGKAYTGSDLKSDTANVTISESCTLSDATIDGDLYLTEGLASDAVQLNDVYVKGTIIVAGGTVTMTNTMSDHIVVSSPMGRLLQVTAAGAARFPSTEVRSTAVLYEKKLTTPGYEGFADVKINGDKRGFADAGCGYQSSGAEYRIHGFHHRECVGLPHDRQQACVCHRLRHDLSGGDQEQRREFCQQRAGLRPHDRKRRDRHRRRTDAHGQCGRRLFRRKA